MSSGKSLHDSSMRWLTLGLFLFSCGDASPGLDAGPAPDASVLDAAPDDAGSDAFVNPVDWEPCPWISDAGSGVNFDGWCATVEMPLDWADPDGPTITIDLRRLDPVEEATADLWMLNGGPGGSAATYERLSLPLRFHRIRVLLMDARGAGRSTRLGCSAEALDSPNGSAIGEEEWADCIADLRTAWGDDLAHFDTTSAARDLIEVVRRTRQEGVRQVVLGASYGTYWVHRAVQLEPDAFDGVVLDSIVPPDDPDLSLIDQWHGEVMRDFLALCDEDDFCADRLGGDAVAATEAMLESVGEGHCAEIFEGVESEAQLLLRVAFGALISDGRARAAIPATVARVERCTPEDVAAVQHLLGVVFGLVTDDDEGPGLFSIVLAHHVTFSELWPDPPPSLEELQAIADAALGHKNLGVNFRLRYDDWPRYEPGPFHDQWATTEVPMLMLNGTLDPQTPIERARRVGAHFAGPHQTFVELPDVSHGVLSGSYTSSGERCGEELLIQFVSDPKAALDTSCVDEIALRDFRLRAAFAQYLFDSDDLWD